MRLLVSIAVLMLVSSLGAAHAATDPAAALDAYRVATGGDAWNGKAVMKTLFKLGGQGLTGSGSSMTDLREGWSIDRYTLGPASGAAGFDGKDAFDYANHMMYLKPLSKPVADLDTYDRAGMWVNAAKGGMQVMDVTADGPAAQAGIEVDDVITQVNDKPATSIPVHELRHMLRDEAPGTVVRLAVKRGEQMLPDRDHPARPDLATSAPRLHWRGRRHMLSGCRPIRTLHASRLLARWRSPARLRHRLPRQPPAIPGSIRSTSITATTTSR
jgi:hypothetical protein